MFSAVQKASRILVRDFGEVEQLQVSRKGPADFVSKSEIKTEKILKEELVRARPRYGFACRKGGVIDGIDISNRWLIDPLDGSINFLHGIPQFCISIALERDHRIEAAMIYQPIADELYYAERGQGSFLNDRRLRVSSRTELNASLLATGLPLNGPEEKDRESSSFWHFELITIASKCLAIRGLGSTALDLAYVAAGRYEGFWISGLKNWTMAAGMLIVREAGGIITDFAGQDKMLERGNIIASNSYLDRELLKMLKSAWSTKTTPVVMTEEIVGYPGSQPDPHGTGKTC